MIGSVFITTRDGLERVHKEPQVFEARGSPLVVRSTKWNPHSWLCCTFRYVLQVTGCMRKQRFRLLARSIRVLVQVIGFLDVNMAGLDFDASRSSIIV
jgi:hypothetical protein